MTFKKTSTYCPPTSEAVPASLAEILCDSVGEASNQDLTFEQWNL